MQTLEKNLDGAVGQAQHLQYLADNAHAAEISGIRLFQLRLALSHQKYLFAVGGLGRLYGLDGSLAPHKERHDRTGEHHHFP